MTCESVKMIATDSGARIQGDYSFSYVKEGHMDGKELNVYLPVPIWYTFTENNAALAKIKPTIWLNGKRMVTRPNMLLSMFEPDSTFRMSMMFFSWPIPKELLRDKYEIKVSYFQPIVMHESERRLMYVPFLPNFEKNLKKFGLDRNRYSFSFENRSSSFAYVIDSNHVTNHSSAVQRRTSQLSQGKIVEFVMERSAFRHPGRKKQR